MLNVSLQKYDISECFSRHYKELFSSVNYYDEAHLFHDVCLETCECKGHGHYVSSGSAHEDLTVMMRCKSDGYDGLASDYLKMLLKFFSSN